MCHHSHSNKHDHQVEKDGSRCKPSELLQCSHLAKEKPKANEYDRTNSEAEAEPGHLGQPLSILNRDLPEYTNEEDALEKIDDVAWYWTEYPERKVTVIEDRVFVRV
jgi:hypothetical protein